MLRRSLIGTSLCLLAACSPDSTAPGGGGPAISVAVVPRSSSLLTSASQDFTATVTNDPSNSGVTWSITGCSGDASVCGSLSNMTSTRATYTAPTTAPPALGVTATAVKDNSKSFTATVAITAIAADGQIAFISDRDGNREIYLMRADGTGLVNLTNNPAVDEGPVWSPDGSKILFETNRDGNWAVYVMNADGSGVNRLLSTGGFAPAWSPDGTKIAFDFHDGNFGIYVMNADGSGLTRLASNAADDRVPAWSPDGGKIAFMSFRDGNWEIYLIHADGSGLVNLTNNPAQDEWPVWSPDGSKIAFITTRDGNPQIYLVNADGSGSTRITSNPWQYFTPVWSPDGTKIAFSGYDGSSQIYVVNADGSNVTRLTSIGSASSPVWSPDGTKIAFTSYRDGNWEIYLMNADGSGLRNLTNNPADDGSPAWRPSAYSAVPIVVAAAPLTTRRYR